MATYSQPAVCRKRIKLSGIVQGVGFRPFVYNLAHKLQLNGFVLNSSSGVSIEVEGPEYAIAEFIDRLRSSPPPLSRIQEIEESTLDPCGYSDFAIRHSVAQAGEFVLVSPDVGTCDDCWRDFSDPKNRRLGYPFTNCTNCGPRYTIIRDIPYDRPSTTMAPFVMCRECQAEYDDPTNRRFHAQPNACSVCGPSLALAENGSFLPHGDRTFGFGDLSLSIMRDVRDALRAGKIVAVRGLGGFLLACDAQNDESVRLLRQRKKRSDKPFALMSRDIASVESFCTVSNDDRAFLLSTRRPIVILTRREHAKISNAVAPGNNTLGVMLPYTPLHYLLFGNSPDEPSEFAALVMTSGNISEEPIVISNEEAWKRLAAVADYFLLHNRDIYMRTDDSVVRSFAGQERVLRRSRGYVPNPIDLGLPVHELLAYGGELKNTFCLTKDHYAILSQHIGDLENYETLLFFEETLANLKKLFRVEPQAVAFDLHPRYMSSRFAQALPLARKIGVQHHHAHIASCMAENHLRDSVIGVAFDGTGYGTDGQVWGGEFLVADFAGFERRAHFRYIPLPGGDAAIRQPWRVALSYLRDAFGDQVPESAVTSLCIPEKERAIAEAMLERRINTVQTSSCGRLFDAVASLIGLRQQVNFEGQAAIELETIAAKGIEDRYSYEITNDDPCRVDFRPTIAGIVGDLASKSQGEIAARFHNTVAAMIVEVCARIRKSDGLRRVCLSGGTFQNTYLLDRTVRELEKQGFEVFLHRNVPPNDGGISLGQAVIANEILRKEL
ncbi:MAG TPA: carbamoyltransferase HypF [Terriglobales bacterium]|nr:carbamoyltransferase HypF [Terriglobales bacterium]